MLVFFCVEKRTITYEDKRLCSAVFSTSTHQSAIREAPTVFSRLPSLMAADKPCPQLQLSLVLADHDNAHEKSKKYSRLSWPLLFKQFVVVLFEFFPGLLRTHEKGISVFCYWVHLRVRRRFCLSQKCIFIQIEARVVLITTYANALVDLCNIEVLNESHYKIGVYLVSVKNYVNIQRFPCK